MASVNPSLVHSYMVTTSSLVQLFPLPTRWTPLLSHLGSPSLDEWHITVVLSNSWSSTSSSAFTATWVVSGNFLIVSECVLGSVLYSACCASQSSWSILSVKVLSLTHALGISDTFNYMLCLPSRTQHPDAPSTCWELVSSVVHCSRQPRFTGYLFTGS